MRILIRVAIALVLVVAIALFGFFTYLDGIAQRAIEEGSTRVLGVETKLDSVRVGLLGGSFGIRGLRVANPPGFERTQFLGIGAGRMELDTGSLWEPVVVVPLLAIDDIEVDLDKERGKANYEVIMDNLARSGSESQPAPEEASEEPGKRFVVQAVVIRDVVAHVRVVGRGRIPQVDVVVPEVRLQNLGTERDPVTPGQLTSLLTQAILASVAKAGADLPGGVVSALSKGLGRLDHVSVDLPSGGEVVDSGSEAAGAVVDAAGTAVESGADVAGDALDAGGDAAEQGAEKAGDAVKGLGRKVFRRD